MTTAALGCIFSGVTGPETAESAATMAEGGGGEVDPLPTRRRPSVSVAETERRRAQMRYWGGVVRERFRELRQEGR